MSTELRLASAAVLCCILGGIVPAVAEPAIAVRTGYRCSQCHMNRTGGGIRTAFGSLYTQTTLPERLLDWRDGAIFLPADPDARFAFGADVRFQYLGEKLDDAEDRSSFEIPEANIYGEFRLAPGRASLYVDENVGPGGASARELFVLLSPRKGRRYVKVGKFLPPFGWRLPDDDAFIRQFSGFSYRAPDVGVEFGVEPGRWSFHVAAVNGPDGGTDDRGPNQLSFVTVRRFAKARMGLSGSNSIGDGVTTTLGGVFGGVNFGRLALLAEGDRVEVTTDAGSEHRLLGFVEADVLLTRGLNIKLAHDWIDPNRDVTTDARTRDSLGVEYIPYPFVQLRLFVRHNDGPPQIAGSGDTLFELELHLFF